MNFVTYKNNFDSVMGEIFKEERGLRGKAARYLRKKVAKKINEPWPSLPGEPPGRDTGNLLKGLKVSNMRTVALTGFVAPAYHAHLLEFRPPSEGGRPFLFSTFAEESGAVKKILSSEVLK